MSQRSHVLTDTARSAVDRAPSQVPTLKFLTQTAPQVSPLGHDPSNRIKIMFNIFSIFYL